MATFDEIRVNGMWFKHQIQEIDQRSRQSGELSSKTGCMALDEAAWPENVQAFKDAYASMADSISTSSSTGYSTGSTRLKAISSGLHETAKAYLRAEAENEGAIRTEILDLLKGF
jgi:hypothetical protein